MHCAVHLHAMQFNLNQLTTNRTDSLQYTAQIAAYKAHPPYGGSNSVPLGLYASSYPTLHRPPHVALLFVINPVPRQLVERHFVG